MVSDRRDQRRSWLWITATEESAKAQNSFLRQINPHKTAPHCPIIHFTYPNNFVDNHQFSEKNRPW